MRRHRQDPILRRADAAYLGSLLVPLSLYGIGVKAAGSASEADGLAAFFSLLRSDLLFYAGYALLWTGLFVLARSGYPRRAAVVGLHAVSLVVVALATFAYQYFESTGTTMDFAVISFYLTTLGEVVQIMMSEAPWYAWVGLAGAVGYVLAGPALVVRLARRLSRGDGTQRSPEGNTNLGVAASLCMIAVGLISFSLFPGTAGADRSYSLTPVANVLVSGLAAQEQASISSEVLQAGDLRPLQDAALEETARTQKRNVVFVVLESTRARSVTPYEDITPSDEDGEGPQITPFMDDLADESLLAERAYTTTPHTSMATTSMQCGIYPDPATEVTAAEPGGIPARCLPELLGEQGYSSAWFQSATEEFENRPQLVENFGYEDFYGLEDMDTEGFERASYLGYEDDIMLEPSRKWLEENADDGPFVANYLTITPHHEYLAPERYGREDLAEDDIENRYLNGVRYTDFFLRNLFEQYKEAGEYEDTIFVIVGDHGEAFGEHGVKGHDGVPYEEGLRVPLMIHDPQRQDWVNGGERIDGPPSNHTDLAPTVLDMLGYRTERGEYPGSSLLDLPEGRTLFSQCRPDRLCSTSLRGDSRYIYNYGKEPEELYDLSEDPNQRDNAAPETDPAELDERREEVLRWHARSGAAFDEPEDR
jgi:arylsulfatase A-like enzyme